MNRKANVKLHPSYAMAYALIVCNEVLGINTMITSAADGVHGENSLHSKGFALDFRSKEQFDTRVSLQKLKIRLGPDFDVLLEDEGGENEHYHVEYDPKTVKKVTA